MMLREKRSCVKVREAINEETANRARDTVETRIEQERDTDHRSETPRFKGE